MHRRSVHHEKATFGLSSGVFVDWLFRSIKHPFAPVSTTAFDFGAKLLTRKMKSRLKGLFPLKCISILLLLKKKRVKKHASEGMALATVDCWLCHWKPYEGDSSTTDRKHEERQACQFSAMAWSWWFTNICIGSNLQFPVTWGDRLGSTLTTPTLASWPHA